MEHLTACREYPHARTLGEHGRCDSRRLLDDRFARVEEEDRVVVAEARDRASKRVGAASVDGCGDEADDVVGAACAHEVDEPRAGAGFAFERAGDFEREPALSDPGRPRQRDEPVLAQQLDHLGELLLATDERRRRGGQVAAAPRRDRGGGDRGVVREDRLLQPAQLGAWLERHLLGEHAPGLAVSLERVGLAAAAIEREHQLPPQPLPERVLLERRSKRGDDLAMVSERERRLELLFERVDSKRLEPPRLGAEPGRVREPVQRRAAPELQRERDRLGRGDGIARAQCTTRLRE